MEGKVVMVDTSILIDYYRKTDKSNSYWVSLVRKGYHFSVSAITKFEIFSGATNTQVVFWKKVFENMEVLPLDEKAIDTAVKINAALKRKRKQIAIADLMIAATAISNKLKFATLNLKHFERIDDLKIIKQDNKLN